MDVKATLKSHIVEEYMYDSNERTLDGDTPLIASGIIDSMGLVQLVEFVKKTFDIEVKEEEVEIENFRSLDAMTAFIDRKMGRSG